LLSILHRRQRIGTVSGVPRYAGRCYEEEVVMRSKRNLWSARGTGLLLLALLAGPVLAQVPPNPGTPPVAPPGGSAADLSSAEPRWLEVKQGTEVATPRVRHGSVTLVAQRARKTTPRFEDCGDETVADHQTGLQWEKKTETTGLHYVNNAYQWSATGTDPDGAAYTEFLAKLNATFDPAQPTGCFADRCDWRLPEISELQTILIGEDADPGQAQTCSKRPCIDPDFAAVSGPTSTGWLAGYWSASLSAGNPRVAWFANFVNGNVYTFFKTSFYSVRAVRTGSCKGI
jgi:hypothetical protein